MGNNRRILRVCEKRTNRSRVRIVKNKTPFQKRGFLYRKNFLKNFKKPIDKIVKMNIIIVTVIVIEVMTSANDKIQPTAGTTA